MMIHEITVQVGKYKARKRVGRGPGSGTGKTAGRGFKGAGSRGGNFTRYQFEGGQMPFFRRLPRWGFTNAEYKTEFWVVNLGDIVAHPAFARGGEVTPQTLIDAGLIRDLSRDVKVLGSMPEGKAALGVKLDVKVARVSAAARRIVSEAGGSVEESGTRRDRVRGVDRNADDHTPKNLTKKLKRYRKHTKG